MKPLSTLLASAALALCFGVGQAAAEEPAGGAGQVGGQSASSGQKADGDAGAYQGGAANRVYDIRVLSPGDSGSVSQSNAATAVGVAANDNDTKQKLDQSQAGGGPGSDHTQVAGQEARSAQDADANATAAQIAPKNEAFSIRVLSPGSNGDVNQSNSATAGAIAANDNDTKQDTEQTQAGGGPGSDSTQIAGQAAANDQEADADATAVQLYPKNTAGSIRVLSPGNDGNVTQSNSTTAIAAGLNDNETKQSIDQSQGGVAAPAKAPEPYAKEQDGKSTGSDYTQIAGQESSSKQKADADATAVQVKPSNTAGSIRVLSPGNGGDVTQSNDATAVGIAKNDNETKQSIDQTQPGGYGSDYTQIAGQKAKNEQKADADATAVQLYPKNTAGSIRVLSPGNDGNVTQSNSTTAIAAGLNDNETKQSIDQSQGSAPKAMASDAMERKVVPNGSMDKGSSSYTQIAGQESSSKQKADADATAVQVKPSNTAGSIRVLSPGNGGDVTQSNDATAVGIAKNDNETKQSIDQTQPGGYGSDYTQIAGQKAKNEQKADADATAVQLEPSNTAGSIRVLSPGNDGNVTQSNSTTAIAAGLNDNETKQSIDQSQGSAPKAMAPDAMERKAVPNGSMDKGGSSYTQIAGQESGNEQKADADATAVQWKPTNTAGSIRVLSPGDGGDVTQSNDATAVGIAENDNETKQSIDQIQGSGYSKGTLPASGKVPPMTTMPVGPYSGADPSDNLQVAGQEASNDQKADADAVALQVKPSNENGSVRVLSEGDDGDVLQSNSTTAIAAALNDNETKQSIDQLQWCGRCWGPDAVQVAGQGSWSRQKADAGAAAVQLGARNENAPVRVGSPSRSNGSVEQSNKVGAVSAALNTTTTKQSLEQWQMCAPATLQVGGQGSWTDQRGGAMTLALQGGMRKKKR